MRKRNVKGNPKKTCSRCGNLLEESRIGKQRYCKACHAEQMRKNRIPLAELSEEQRVKKKARTYAAEYTRRGKLKKEPCYICGSPDSERHHEDYAKPLEVKWICRPCHLSIHKNSKEGDFANSNISPTIPNNEVGRCSKCGNAKDRGYGRAYCKNCHNAYMRVFRKKQTEELKMLRLAVKV